MDRRSFINWVGVGAIATSLPVAIAACSTKVAKQPTGSAPATPASEFQPIGTVAQLDQTGSLLNKDTAIGAVLVIRDTTDPSKLIAVNPTCPHKGCIVDWKADQKSFVCPCHGAKFASSGQVSQGPATEALPTYLTKLAGQTILVKAA
jgi:cytochrome b6-f complex iron-sulfur subunit